MEGDRKYRQRGYMDTERGEVRRDDKPRPQGPRPPLDVTGPRLPRLVQPVTAARCANCSTTLPADINFQSNCPKCNAELHCCRQCGHFEPSTRFQCLKPIPARISSKDKANDCPLFEPRVTVMREGTSNTQGGRRDAPGGPSQSGDPPRTASDARLAFDRLFKKD